MISDNPKFDVVDRDYKSIYKDLINAIPSLTNQWSVSDESDPGIVLVKLMSMLGDMLSYNTDKAYLEAYPDTVTQRKNAYQIFKLIGYKMKWYRSATCDCYFNNANSSLTDVIYIPRFTRFYSSDRSICYTNPTEDLYIVSGINGQVDGRQQTKLIEGIPVTPDIYADTTVYKNGTSYTFNGNSAWHSIYKYNVDKTVISNNRIYFNVQNVEQNYITLIDDSGNVWNKVENIDIADNLNERLFEFDVDEFDKPYIKLIDYWEELNITKFKLFYIQSSGINGKVNAKILKRAESDAFNLLNSRYPELLIVNSEGTDGFDPETADDARKASANYINTFDTLVTLDDFAKFAKRFDFVGNAIAKDKTNDFNGGLVTYYNSLNMLVNGILSNFNINTNSFAHLTNTNNFSVSVSYEFDTSNYLLNRVYNGILWRDITDNYKQLLDHITKMFGLQYDAVIGQYLKIMTQYFSNRTYYTYNGTNFIKYTGTVLSPNVTYYSPVISSDTEVNSVSDIYELIYLSNKDADTESEVDYNDYIECVINQYNIDTGRSISLDLSYLSQSQEINKNDVNLYITPANGYNFSEYRDELDEKIYNTKIMPLDINTTTNGVDYYNWTMSGVVYLKTPVSYSKAQEVLININNKLKYDYSIENIGYCNPVKPIDLINSIMASDPQIYYVDLGNIEYTRKESFSGRELGSPITNKDIISGNKYIQNLPYSNFMSRSSGGMTTFTLDLLNDKYTVNNTTHSYLEDYDSVDITNGNVLIEPGSFYAVIDDGTYIIKDNGFGSLVCNENILESSVINYRINENKLLVRFTINSNIIISTTSKVNIKFRRNKLTMVLYSGLNPNIFTIDDESIEV